tara:strand:+ start:5057 stop:5326 length:270 start_codon:yes stop_codon:yes gene_type:complete
MALTNYSDHATPTSELDGYRNSLEHYLLLYKSLDRLRENGIQTGLGMSDSWGREFYATTIESITTSIKNLSGTKETEFTIEPIVDHTGL